MAEVLIVSITACVAIILGRMAEAWRRACVTIARTVLITRQAYEQTDFDTSPILRLSQKDIIKFTPRGVSARHILALGIWLLTVVLSFILFY